MIWITAMLIASLRNSDATVAIALANQTAPPAVTQTWISGSIVDIRADVVQVRESGKTELSRVVLSSKSTFESNTEAGLEILTLNDRVFARGTYDPQKGFHPSMIRAFTPDGRSHGPSAGLGADSYSQLFTLEGTVSSVAPLLVKDDSGKAYAILGADYPVRKQISLKRESLKLGMFAYFHGDKAPDGLTTVDEVFIPQDGQDDYYRGPVKTVAAGKLSIWNQFEGTSDVLDIPSDASVLIGTDVDPDSIKVGTPVSVIGISIRGGDAAPEEVMASSLAVEPFANVKLDTSVRGSEQLELRGVIESISPCRIRLPDARLVVVDVPGNALIQVIRPARLLDLRPGDVATARGKMDHGVFKVSDVLAHRTS